MRSTNPPTCPRSPLTPQSGMLTQADRAAGIIFAHTSAVLLTGEHPWSLRYISAFDGSGLVFVASEPDMLKAEECELHIPDESLELRSDAAIAMVSIKTEPVESISQVRWEAFHGEPAADRFAVLKLHAVRISGEVFDEAEINLANPLSTEQASLCSRANQPGLAEAVERTTGTMPGEARAVGVDPFGVHVRGAFIVHRLRFPERASDANHALSMIDSLLDSAE